MDNDLKLYVWEGVLCDYTCGVIFALAHDVREARQLVLAGGGNSVYTSDMVAEPQVFDSPIGFSVLGGG